MSSSGDMVFETLMRTDYWVPQVRAMRVPKMSVNGIEVEGTFLTTTWHPFGPAKALRMLCHFHALDRDGD